MIRFTLGDKQTGPKFRFGVKRQARAVGIAAASAALEASEEIKRLGSINIRGAGRFGTRWTEGLKSEPVVEGDSIRVRTVHTVPYFNVFEFGAVIKGKPLLWIPLSFAVDAQGTRARDFPGGLFRVDRHAGAPLLLSRVDGEPKYFGKQRVTIPRKFRIRDIAATVARGMRELYRKHKRLALR